MTETPKGYTGCFAAPLSLKIKKRSRFARIRRFRRHEIPGALLSAAKKVSDHFKHNEL